MEKIKKEENFSASELLVSVGVLGLIIFGIFWLVGNLSNPTVVSPSTTNTSTTFYTKSANTNIRGCGSLSCDVIGQYPMNTSWDLPYATVDDLPEWVKISWQDNSGVTQAGYINKATLGISQVKNSVLIKKQPETTPPVVRELNLQQPLELQQIGDMQAYAGGPLYYEVILNSAPWNEYDNNSMKILLSPYVCAVNVNVLQMNNGYPVSFSLKSMANTNSGKTFFITFRTGDCNNYLWGNY